MTVNNSLVIGIVHVFIDACLRESWSDSELSVQSEPVIEILTCSAWMESVPSFVGLVVNDEKRACVDDDYLVFTWRVLSTFSKPTYSLMHVFFTLCNR